MWEIVNDLNSSASNDEQLLLFEEIIIYHDELVNLYPGSIKNQLLNI